MKTSEQSKTVERILWRANLAVLNGDHRLATLAIRDGEAAVIDDEHLQAINALAVQVARVALSRSRPLPDRLQPAFWAVAHWSRSVVSDTAVRHDPKFFERALQRLPKSDPKYAMLSRHYTEIAKHAAALGRRSALRAS